MAMLPIVDHIRANATVPAGTARDTAAAAPAAYVADTFYAWPGVDRRVVEGDGTVDDSRFTVELALTVAADETPDVGRDRAVSVALDDGADDLAAWVRGNRANELWDHLQVDQIVYDELRGLEYRGVRLTLSGFREVTS